MNGEIDAQTDENRHRHRSHGLESQPVIVDEAKHVDEREEYGSATQQRHAEVGEK